MTITNAVERRIGIRNTQAFIRANVTRVRLLRPVVIETEAGGVRKGGPDTLPEQEFRIVPMSGLVWDRSRTSPDEGKIPDVTEMLIGMPDADMEQDDYFPNETGRGGWYKIVHVSPVEGYRREARLRWLSSEPRS